MVFTEADCSGAEQVIFFPQKFQLLHWALLIAKQQFAVVGRLSRDKDGSDLKARESVITRFGNEPISRESNAFSDQNSFKSLFKRTKNNRTNIK